MPPQLDTKSVADVQKMRKLKSKNRLNLTFSSFVKLHAAKALKGLMEARAGGLNMPA